MEQNTAKKATNAEVKALAKKLKVFEVTEEDRIMMEIDREEDGNYLKKFAVNW